MLKPYNCMFLKHNNFYLREKLYKLHQVHNFLKNFPAANEQNSSNASSYKLLL